ncbi:MAG: hypothetical protein ACYDCO_04420 [Armatimonadota bacterium]
MRRLQTLWIVAALLAFGNVALAYPTLNAETANVGRTNSAIAGSDRWNLLLANENPVIIRTLYGSSEQSASPTSNVVERISSPLKFNLAGGGSLSLAINLKGAVKIRYSIPY